MDSFVQFDHVSVKFGLFNTDTSHICYLKIVEGIFFLGNYKDIDYVISSYEFSSVTRMGDSAVCNSLRLKTKYFLCSTITFANDKDMNCAYDMLLGLITKSSYTDAVAFYPTIIPQHHQICQFPLEDEFRRLGLPNAHWRITTTLNKGFKLCSTYPDVLVVPQNASDKLIQESAAFRSRKRIPVLCYHHQKTMTSLCRSSQPLVGLNNRNESDERLIEIMAQCSDSPKKLLVVDTRPKINAIANRASGKGYELKQFYPNIEFRFRPIENIHVMRNSLSKMIDAMELNCSSLEAISLSMWLSHLQAVIDCSVFIAEQLIGGFNILAHCSDGWDRTSQTCALATLLLDPYHRTIEGFWTLIEREWLSFGHQFAIRCGHLSVGDPKFISPIFVQFIDCVWQIYIQFPHMFQFDDRLLIFILRHSFSCSFGDFLYNCPNERVTAGLYSHSVPSLYTHIQHNINQFVNHLYDHNKNMSHSPFLSPNSDIRVLRLWTKLYAYGGRSQPGDVPVNELVDQTIENETSLLAEFERLKKSIHNLVNEKGFNYSRELVSGMSNFDLEVFDHLDLNKHISRE